ncbi:secreted RxLR effector protein 161-like [Gossypium arboreum]|uniref:secreted RxLR effector protein 161-like n=1 Tax=Gossypium arboreum TaxID=29729 RepID=UPI00081969D8|nr:secreted RxLR effector protein 161-like [Gossypium arboreum]
MSALLDSHNTRHKFAVSLLSRFMHCYNVNHFQATKRVLKYIEGTLNFGMMFTKVDSMKLLGFTDSDWAGLIDDMKSTQGICLPLVQLIFFLISKKQTIVAQSTAEPEYIATAGAVNQVIWLRKIMADMNLHQREAR